MGDTIVALKTPVKASDILDSGTLKITNAEIGALKVDHEQELSAGHGVVCDSDVSIATGKTLSGNVAASGMFSSNTQVLQASGGASGAPVYANQQRVGNKFTTLSAGLVIWKAIVSMKKTGSPTGNAVMTIRRVSDDAVLQTSNNFDVSTLTGSFTDVTFTFPTVALLPPSTAVRISVEFTGGNVSNYPELDSANTGAISGVVKTYYGTSTWTDSGAGYGTKMTVYYGYLWGSL